MNVLVVGTRGDVVGFAEIEMRGEKNIYTPSW